MYCWFLAASLLGAASARVATPGNETLPYLDAALPAHERARDLLGRMTWEDKVGQLGGIRRAVSRVNGEPSFNRTAFEQTRKTQNGQVGLGFQMNWADEVLPIVNELRQEQIDDSRLHIPYITIADSVNGIWVSGGTLFPGTNAMASSWNVNLYAQAVEVIRDENLAIGVQWVLSPEVDLAKDPRNGRNGEMYGEDAYLASEFATQYIKTMQEQDDDGWVKVATTIKHWVYGQGSGGVNRASMHGGINHVLNDLGAPYIKPIREAKPLSLMASYASVDHVPLSVNRHLLQDVLRDIVGFQGLIMSDANAIEYLYTESKVARSPMDAAKKAIKAGLEHELHPGGHGVFTTLIDAEDDEEIVSLLDESVLALLQIKFLTGQFDKPLPTIGDMKATLRKKEHLEVNKNMSRESIVMLQNDGLLPLTKGHLGKVAVIGPYADIINAGMYAACNSTDPAYGSSFRRSMERELGADAVLYAQGTNSILPSNDTDDASIQEAVSAAKDAGLAVLVLGSGLGTFDPSTVNNERTDQEGFAHADLSFPGQQQQLLEAVLDTGIPTILIMSSGQNFLLPDSILARTSAVFHSFLSGEFTGDVLVEILLGETNPSGKLTVTIPEANGAFPVAYDFLPSDDRGGFGAATKYDWHWPQLTRSPALRFGYGLSYTSFEIGNVTATAARGACNTTAVHVSASVTNTGERAGQEVVQVYYRPDVSVIEMPVMKLIRFSKVEVEAGDTVQVEFVVPGRDLGYFVNGDWVADGGDYAFWVGSSSRLEDLTQVNVTLSH
ncbi:beta-glucosidase [Emericellopsis atlantica]|uniref:beta-glucosidase n=1 Tax=Emericellopsis atlantica TaxID=2614577 RepID=A0A9P7ZIX9_9HYPO|nr:beta-glucosidase [Emericellopsis atlantica]KAG9252850.1 beta-glucosidase [Emericellopsis atlantica]